MKFIYVLQLIFLVLPFVMGYRMALSPFRIVLIALVNELVYCSLLYVLYFKGQQVVAIYESLLGLFTTVTPYTADIIDVFDLYRLEKELWLFNFISWMAKLMGNSLRLYVADTAFMVLSFTGGFFVTVIAVLGGSIFRNAIYSFRMDAARPSMQ